MHRKIHVRITGLSQKYHSGSCWYQGSAKLKVDPMPRSLLVYYPLYHSKYNPIEPCWRILENHWSGTLLNSIETTLEWAKSITWKGINPVVELLSTVYKKGIKISKQKFKATADRIKRNASLPKYYVPIPILI
jgi:transposase